MRHGLGQFHFQHQFRPFEKNEVAFFYINVTFNIFSYIKWVVASLMAQMVKNVPARW